MSEKISMRKIREIIRISASNPDFSNRKIARALKISHPVVSQYLSDYKNSGLNINDIDAMNDNELFEILQGKRKKSNERYNKLCSQFEYITKELKKSGVTLQILWEEYRDEYPNGYSLSQFMYHYQIWRETSNVTMHIEHKAGDKVFVDFTGKKMQITDRETGEKRDVETFVALLASSQLTYVEATESQKKRDFIGASENALIYFNGSPAAIVPDCLKSAVTKGSKYEPDINPEYADFARHYDTVILPARPYKPKDKALVEGAVKIVYAWIYATLRNRIFYSLRELNTAIYKELERYNNKPMQKLKISRRQMFEEVEKNELKPLPAQTYRFRSYCRPTVQLNYHLYLREDKHYYSVPWRYKGHKVDVFFTETAVEVYHNHSRIAFHLRDRRSGKYTTEQEHMPSHHRFVAEWNRDRFIRWAGSVGTFVEDMVIAILDTKKHPEQGFKSCLGILQQLEKEYGKQRLNSACKKALSLGYYSYYGVKNILKNNLEDYDEQEDLFREVLPEHDNIRGINYYN